MNEDDERGNREKLLFYFEEKIEVHVKKKNGGWWNGILVRPKGDNVFIMQEREEGEVFLFISDIVPNGVSEFREVGG